MFMFPAVILLQGRPEEAESGSRGLLTSLVALPAAYVLYLWVLEAAEGASSRSWEGLACTWVPAPFLLVPALSSCHLTPLHRIQC